MHMKYLFCNDLYNERRSLVSFSLFYENRVSRWVEWIASEIHRIKRPFFILTDNAALCLYREPFRKFCFRLYTIVSFVYRLVQLGGVTSVHDSVWGFR